MDLVSRALITHFGTCCIHEEKFAGNISFETKSVIHRLHTTKSKLVCCVPGGQGLRSNFFQYCKRTYRVARVSSVMPCSLMWASQQGNKMPLTKRRPKSVDETTTTRKQHSQNRFRKVQRLSRNPKSRLHLFGRGCINQPKNQVSRMPPPTISRNGTTTK